MDGPGVPNLLRWLALLSAHTGENYDLQRGDRKTRYRIAFGDDTPFGIEYRTVVALRQVIAFAVTSLARTSRRTPDQIDVAYQAHCTRLNVEP